MKRAMMTSVEMQPQTEAAKNLVSPVASAGTMRISRQSGVDKVRNEILANGFCCEVEGIA